MSDRFAELLDAWHGAVAHNARIQGKDDVSAYHEDVPVDEETPRAALLAYLHDIETRCDPAGEVQRMASLEEQARGLEAKLAETERMLQHVQDCTAMDGCPFASLLGEEVDVYLAALAVRRPR
jgi:hypothetical protein